MSEITLEKIKEQLRRKSPDFAKDVAPIFALMGWTWGKETPDEDRILERLFRLINDMDGCTTLATGRLFVTISLDEREAVLGLEYTSNIYW